jgi:hypothetical protein
MTGGTVILEGGAIFAVAARVKRRFARLLEQFSARGNLNPLSRDQRGRRRGRFSARHDGGGDQGESAGIDLGDALSRLHSEGVRERNKSPPQTGVMA